MSRRPSGWTARMVGAPFTADGDMARAGLFRRARCDEPGGPTEGSELKLSGAWWRWPSVVAVVAMSAAMSACSDSGASDDDGEVSMEQVRAIAKQAYVYGFPMVDNYRIQYSYFVDKQGANYKGAWNQIH